MDSDEVEHVHEMDMRRKRLALFIPSFSGGGAERVMITLANSFSARSMQVDLIVLSANGPYIKEVKPEVRVVELKAARAIAGIRPLSAYLRDNKPDVLLVTMRHTAICAYFARRLAGMTNRTALFVREAISPSFDRINTGLSARVMRLFLRLMYKNVDAVISTTPQMTQELASCYAFKQLHTIGNPVVTEQFKALMADVKCCKFPWPDDDKVVIAAGRMVQQKDFKTLIDAFAIANREITSRLVILGEGELRQQLEAQIDELELKDRVWLPGFVENPIAYMVSSNAFVMSSLMEGLPNVLIQALCCGIPVVSTRCPTGPEDLLENGKYGMLVDVGDTHAMARCIVETLRYEKLSSERSAFFSNRYNVDNIIDQYSKILF